MAERDSSSGWYDIYIAAHKTAVLGEHDTENTAHRKQLPPARRNFIRATTVIMHKTSHIEFVVDGGLCAVLCRSTDAGGAAWGGGPFWSCSVAVGCNNDYYTYLSLYTALYDRGMYHVLEKRKRKKFLGHHTASFYRAPVEGCVGNSRSTLLGIMSTRTRTRCV